MGYYKICPLCGAHLDPGERCDCEEVHQPFSGISVNYPGVDLPLRQTRKNNYVRTVFTERSITND